MGYGITHDELQEIVSDVTNFDVDKRERHEVSDKVVRGLFCRHGIQIMKRSVFIQFWYGEFIGTICF